MSLVSVVVDSDCTEEIEVLISPPTKTVQIGKGRRIAQLLLLPCHQTGKTLTSQARGPRGFRSSDLAFWAQEITASRPLTDLYWPSSWPTHTTENELVGLEKVVCGVRVLQRKR